MNIQCLHFDPLSTGMREARSRRHLRCWVSHRSAVTVRLSNATYFYPNSPTIAKRLNGFTLRTGPKVDRRQGDLLRKLPGKPAGLDHHERKMTVHRGAAAVFVDCRPSGRSTGHIFQMRNKILLDNRALT